MIYLLATLTVGFLLDGWLGDPKGKPHPVRIIGSCISKLERWLGQKILNKFMAGAILFLLITIGTAAVATAIWLPLHLIYPLLGVAAGGVMVYYALSIRSLEEEAMAVYHLLKNRKIEDARRRLSEIVGRDTEKMDEAEVSRAVIETVAENFVDGVVSPIFYATLGGGVLALAYKAVNTLDSMVGYRNEWYEQLGKVSARADDMANFIPARLSIIFIAIAALFTGHSATAALRIAKRDRKNHESPNAAHPESCFAGALKLRLGGNNYYGGLLSVKPIIGQGGAVPSVEMIPEAVRLMRAASIISLIGTPLTLYSLLLLARF